MAVARVLDALECAPGSDAFGGRFPCSPRHKIAQSPPKRFNPSALALAIPSVECVTLLRCLLGGQWVLARPFRARYGLGVKRVYGRSLDSAVDQF